MGTQERREREKLQRRQDIMEAAKGVFFEKGLQSATMDEIADAVELSKGTLYLYFQSKEELYLSLLAEGDQILAKLIRDSIKPADLVKDQIKALANAYYIFYKDYSQYYKIMFYFQHGEFPLDKVSGDLYRTCHDDAFNMLKFVESLIQSGIKKGEFREVCAWDITLMLWSTATGIFAMLNEKSHKEFIKNVNDGELLDFSVDIILSGIEKQV